MDNNTKTIIDVDFDRHHKNREYDRTTVHSLIDNYLDKGGEMFTLGSVVILHEGVSPLEFHCFNSGGGRELTEAINALLKSKVGLCDRAVTYYDNPRISELANYSYFPCSIKRIDAGIDKTYEMNFDLRGM